MTLMFTYYTILEIKKKLGEAIALSLEVKSSETGSMHLKLLKKFRENSNTKFIYTFQEYLSYQQTEFEEKQNQRNSRDKIIRLLGDF